MSDKRKPKFKVGQVVAIWYGTPYGTPCFYRIKSFFWDNEDVLR